MIGSFFERLYKLGSHMLALPAPIKHCNANSDIPKDFRQIYGKTLAPTQSFPGRCRLRVSLESPQEQHLRALSRAVRLARRRRCSRPDRTPSTLDWIST